MTDTETPEVTARVEENWAAFEIDGETQTIRADTEEEVRYEVLRRTVQLAVEVKRDVRLIATDRDGEWRLVVTPDGEVSETGAPNHAHGTHGGAGAEPDAAPADTISAPPTAGVEVVDPPDRSAGDEDPRPYYDFSGPIDEPEPVGEGPIADVSIVEAGHDEQTPTDAAAPTNDGVLIEDPARTGDGLIDDELEQTTFREPIAATETTAAVSTDTLSTDTIDTDTVRRDSLPSGPALGDEHQLPTPTPVIGDPPAFSSTPDASSTPDTAAVPDTSPVTPAPDEPVALAPDEPADEADAGPVTIAATGERIADAAEPAEPAPSVRAAAPASAPQPPLPTLADFQATQPPPVAGPASQGWRGAIRRGTGGLISPRPSVAEQRHREAIASVTRSLSGPRTICVINPKGGAHKTTATMLIAATFGMYRGGYTLAWDNNETRGTLGWRAHQARHTNTAVNLLNDIDRFTDLRSARVGDLDNYVRSQAEAQFDVLASDEDAAASSMIDGEGFRRLHETLQRFYRIIVVDTGNNMRASNWEAAIAAADQLVIVSAIREDTAGGAAWMVEGLARKGQEEKLRDAVTILSAPDKNTDAKLRSRLFDHFGSLTRDVVEVPYDPALVSGGGIVIDSLAPTTREAWLTATATIANGL